MQVEIDFDVYKALTALRRNEEDGYCDVIRRLLVLAEISPPDPERTDGIVRAGRNTLADLALGNIHARDGAWIGNVFFPNGTRFRATYKGRTFRASIVNEQWVGEDGVTRKSPSEAAGAISDTTVNGWRFWYAQRPQDEDWQRLDEFRK